MKILHVISNFAPNYGGPVTVCRDLSIELIRQGVNVTIFTTHLDFPRGVREPPIDCCLVAQGVKLCYFPVQFRRMAVSHQMASAFWNGVRDYDVVHIHGLYRFPSTFGAWCARKQKVPYLIRPHGSLDPYLYNQKRHRRLKRVYEHFFEFPNLKGASAIHFTTEGEREVTRFLGLDEKGIVIPNGLDLSLYDILPERGRFRAKYQLGAREAIVLFLGRINFKKGLDLLIPSFASLFRSHSSIRLVIAGPDNDGYASQVREWIALYGIGEKVLFTGMLDRNETLEAYVDADVFALPSYTENFGMTVVEAMACGCPVVISDKVNIWRDVQEAEAGLITSCDSEQVVEAIQKVLQNPDLRRKMGLSGRRLVYGKYGWEKIATQMIEVYKSLSEK